MLFFCDVYLFDIDVGLIDCFFERESFDSTLDFGNTFSFLEVSDIVMFALGVTVAFLLV